MAAEETRESENGKGGAHGVKGFIGIRRSACKCKLGYFVGCQCSVAPRKLSLVPFQYFLIISAPPLFSTLPPFFHSFWLRLFIPRSCFCLLVRIFVAVVTHLQHIYNSHSFSLTLHCLCSLPIFFSNFRLEPFKWPGPNKVIIFINEITNPT